MCKNKRLLLGGICLCASLYLLASPEKTWNGSSWNPYGEPTMGDHVIINSVFRMSETLSNKLVCAELTINIGGVIIFDIPDGYIQVNGNSINIDVPGGIQNTSTDCYIEIASPGTVTITSGSLNKLNIPDGVYLKISSGAPVLTESTLHLEAGGWIEGESLNYIIGELSIDQSGQSDTTAWNLWASPVVLPGISNVYGSDATAYRFPDGGTSVKDWIALNAGSTNMTGGKGYCINGGVSTSVRVIDGGGSSKTSYQPFNNYWEAGRTQILYLQSEIGAASVLTEMSLNIKQVSGYSYRDFDNFKIKLLQTPDHYFSSTSFKDMTEATTVFDQGVYNMPGSTGWHTWDIEDFVFNGTENLLVEISWGDNEEYTGYSDRYRVEHTKTANKTVCYGYTDYDDGENITADGKNKKRPNIKFSKAATSTRIFNGTLNTTASYVPSSPGYVLLGNPFASFIDLYNGSSGFFDSNPELSGTAYFWIDDASAGAGYSGSDYAYWNASGATEANGVLPAGKLAPGQGFFVDVISTPAAINFNTGHCVNSMEGFHRNTESQESMGRIWLSIVDEQGLSSEMLLAFTDSASMAEDRLYDGKKIVVVGNIGIYSFIDNRPFAIQGMPGLKKNERIPLGVITNKTAYYTIKIKSTENLPDGTVLYLEDCQNNQLHNIAEEDYEIVLHQDTFNQRFSLHIKLPFSEIKETEQEVSLHTYVKGQVLFLKGLRGLGHVESIEIYDLSGRLIMRKHYGLSLSGLQIPLESGGLHILRLHTEKGLIHKKVFI